MADMADQAGRRMFAWLEVAASERSPSTVPAASVGRAAAACAV